MTLPANFDLFVFNEWVKRSQPISIELTDKEYQRLASLKGTNIKEWQGIPIVFIDKPIDVIK